MKTWLKWGVWFAIIGLLISLLAYLSLFIDPPIAIRFDRFGLYESVKSFVLMLAFPVYVLAVLFTPTIPLLLIGVPVTVGMYSAIGSVIGLIIQAVRKSRGITG